MVIYTDSNELLKNIQEGTCPNRPEQMRNIINLIDEIQDLGTTVEICWIPGHNGIPGNERADCLAKKAKENEDIDIITRNEIKDQKLSINKYILSMWQDR